MQQNNVKLQYVVPFYLDFLHGNFMRTGKEYSVASPHRIGWEEWHPLLCQKLETITPTIAGDLMMESDWRPQICAGYYIGLKRWDDFTLNLGQRLIDKKNGYATQGYAFALARMPSHASANYLCGYLNRVGHWNDKTDWYSVDIEWVLAALKWVDTRMGTHRIDEYLEKLTPFWQKQIYEANLRYYRELPKIWSSLEHNSNAQPDLTSKFSQIQKDLEATEMKLDDYYNLDSLASRNSEWFENLMIFCATHFDSKA